MEKDFKTSPARKRRYRVFYSGNSWAFADVYANDLIQARIIAEPYCEDRTLTECESTWWEFEGVREVGPEDYFEPLNADQTN